MAVERPAHCENCPFRESRTVGGDGPLDAPFIVVGEAPGAMELAEGKPFIGRSGELLRRALHEAGLTELTVRNQVRITNAVQCLPTIGNAAALKKGILACNKRLHRELEAAPRRAILAVGNSALRAVTNDHSLKITRQRGVLRYVPLSFDTAQGEATAPVTATVKDVPCVAALHPAAILRSGGSNYPQFAADIAYAVSVARGDLGRVQIEPTYSVATPEDVGIIIKILEGIITDRANSGELTHGKVPVAIDTETTGLDPFQARLFVFGIAVDPERVFIFPMELFKDRPDLVYQLDRIIFDNPDVSPTYHNSKFDANFLRKHLGVSGRIGDDTMLLSYCLNEQKGYHSLEQCASDHLGAVSWKDELKKYLKEPDGYLNAPRDQLYEYLAKDVSHTLQLYHALLPRVDEDKGLAWLYHKFLIPAANVLSDIEYSGIKVSRQALYDLETTLETKKREAIAGMRQILKNKIGAGVRKLNRETGKSTPFTPESYNPNSHQQNHFVIYTLFKLKARDLESARSIKQYNTNKETLALLEDHPFVEALTEYRVAHKMLDTYIKGLIRKIDTHGRVHPTVNLHQAETGRLSQDDPNLQNVPREGTYKGIRNVFVAPEGRILIEFDYSQAELRVLAVQSGDPYLREVYENDRDLHNEMSIRLWGPDYTANQRDITKRINFGIVYGITPSRLMRLVGLSYDECQELIDLWFQNVPYVKRYMTWLEHHPRDNKPIRTPFGRMRRFPFVTEETRHHALNEAKNFPIQSIASDLTLSSAITVAKRLPEWNAFLVNTVHDSLMAEAPDDPQVVQEIVTYVRRVMETLPGKLLKTTIPFKADVKTGYTWGAMKALEANELALQTDMIGSLA